MRHIKILCWAVIILMPTTRAFADIFYRATIRSQSEADYLMNIGAKPIFRLADGYLILVDDRAAELIGQAGITAELIASDISREELFIDPRPTPDADLPYSLLFTQDNIHIYRGGPLDKMSAPLVPLLRTLDKIIYTPQKIYSPPATFGDIDLNWLIGQIRQDSLESYLRRLEAFNGRLTGTPSNYAARDWIAARFASLGYDSVYIAPFIGSQLWDRHFVQSYNVVATKVGSRFPDRQIVIGGHFDAVPDCPGADDNASGTSCVLEVARVLADIETEMTIVFIAFDSEESWMWGSYDYVAWAVTRGDNIIYMLNPDMIGHLPNYNQANLYYGPVRGYAELWQALADSLVNISAVLAGQTASDHLPFIEAGFDVTFVQEYFFSSHYHDPNDSSTYINFDYMTRMVQASLATIFVINESPLAVPIVSLKDGGNGRSLQINWDNSDAANIDFYRVYFDTNPGTALDSIDVSPATNSYLINGLTFGQEYQVYLKAFDVNGQSSILISPAYNTPRIIPQPPAQIIAHPRYRAVELSWEGHNTELDFSHFTIIRDGVPLPGMVTEQTFLDDDFSLGNRLHSYHVVSVDDDGNMSDTVGKSPIVTRAATLEPGRVLAVNRSSYLSNLLVNEAVTGEFIRDALSPFNFDYISDTMYAITGDDNHLGLFDFLDYELIVLGGESARVDDFGTSPASGGVMEDIAEYLSLGGKAIIFGRWGNITTTAKEMDTVTFISGSYNYGYHSHFHIDRRVRHLSSYSATIMNSDLVGAKSQASGYPDLVWDSLAAVNHTAPWTQVSGIPCPSFAELTPGVPEIEILYTYDSRDDYPGTENKTVAWRYSGNIYQYIFFQIPLTFFDRPSAKTALQAAVMEFLSPGPVCATVIDPDTIDADQVPATSNIFLGDFSGDNTAEDIDLMTLSINGAFSPLSAAVEPSHPELSGPVVNILVSNQSFISSYGPLNEEAADYGYLVSWRFSGETETRAVYGSVTLTGSDYVSGDVNGDRIVNVGDAVFIINYSFRGGPAPDPLAVGDANCDGSVNVGDAVYLVNYVFRGGAPPVDPCGL